MTDVNPNIIGHIRMDTVYLAGPFFSSSGFIGQYSYLHRPGPLGNIRAFDRPKALRDGYSIIMKTVSARKETVQRSWYLVDARDKTLGRLSTEIANRLRGKHKPEFTPHVDTGDYVVVVNAEKVKVTGNKYTDKVYYRHTGYPGGIRSYTFGELMQKSPERAIEMAVKGMMPKNRLSKAMLSKLKVYAGGEHPHLAQQPTPLEI